MLPPRSKKLPLCVLIFTACTMGFSLQSIAGDAYKWSVQYLIDNSRTIFGRPQKTSPRHNRGLAISPDGKYLYAGYHHSFGSGEVRRIRIDVADYDRATEALLPGVLGKAIATDDKGRVYISDNACIYVYDALLEHKMLRIPTDDCEGLTTAREGGQLVLYTTERGDATLNRLVLQESGADVTAATLSGFESGSGVLKIPGAVDPRGMKIDAKGNFWIADLKGNKLFRISQNGKEVKSVAVPVAFDVALDGERVFVTRSTERAITVLDQDLNVIGSLNVPWEELELSPYGNNRNGALSGIVCLPGKGFFVTNEAGQTANQRSTYGRVDEHSDFVNGKMYRDVFGDDNEPILRATEVETAP
ncbi:MAG TPA: hypothetical protein VK961_19440 [Chthoniobacter sp.]|nr:hypothetical protein [Chthoniobacter sp.]